VAASLKGVVKVLFLITKPIVVFLIISLNTILSTITLAEDTHYIPANAPK
jgi:hypothetical protein